MHFGFFDEYDLTFQFTGVLENGENASIIESNGTVKVDFRGIQRKFKLDDSWKDSGNLRLGSGETLITGVLDESGYYFWLIDNKTANRIYYVLNELKSPEPRSTIESGGVNSVSDLSRDLCFLKTMTDRFWWE